MAKIRTRKVTDRVTRFDREGYEAPAVIGGGRAPEVEEVLLFSYQADAKSELEEFYVPVKVPRAVSMRVMEVYTERGEVAATIYMLKELVGLRAWEILSNEDSIDGDSYDAIVDATFKIVLGDQGKAGRRG